MESTYIPAQFELRSRTFRLRINVPPKPKNGNWSSDTATNWTRIALHLVIPFDGPFRLVPFAQKPQPEPIRHAEWVQSCEGRGLVLS